MGKKRVLKDFRLDKIAAVDTPCQEGATMTIMKRAEESDPGFGSAVVQKFLGVEELSRGAHDFTTVFNDEARRQNYWENVNKVQPMLISLEDSLKSIVGDGSLSLALKRSAMQKSVDDFMAAVTDQLDEGKAADVAKALRSVIEKSDNEGDTDMSDELKKQVADLEKKLSEQAAEIEKAQAEKAEAELVAKMSDKEKAFTEKMSDKEKAAFMAMDDKERKAAMSKAAAKDEVIKVGDTEIAKSVVGDAQFAIIKAQQEQLAEVRKQAQEDREKLEKANAIAKAKTEYSHLPGEDLQKGDMVLAMEAMDPEVRKSFETVLKAHEDLLRKGFDTLGHKGDGNVNADIAKAKETFYGKVSEIAKRDDVTRTQALAKARKEFPDLFASFQGN